MLLDVFPNQEDKYKITTDGKRTELEETGIKQNTVRLHQEEDAIHQKEPCLKQDDTRVEHKLVDRQQVKTQMRQLGLNRDSMDMDMDMDPLR